MHKLVIGLEIHIQLSTTRKLFCRCASSYGKPPNTTVCPICLGLPGSMPVLNKEAVNMGIGLGLALGGSVQLLSQFDRKNYFYPDLPKGYQITQYFHPLVKKAYMQIQHKRINIERIILEEDSAKLTYHKKTKMPFIDYNRAGVPLLEVITLPDFDSPDQVIRFLTNLKQLTEYLGISSGKMEEGALRCDVNISLSATGKQPNYRIEVKNLNSLRSVSKSILYELSRQQTLMRQNHLLVSETRGYDDKKEETFLLRKKAKAIDYRYFPEPDLPPVRLDQRFIQHIHIHLPELPSDAKKRLMETAGLSIKKANSITESRDLCVYFDNIISMYPYPKIVVNWLLTDFTKILKKFELSVQSQQMKPYQFVSLMQILDTGTLSRYHAKKVLEIMMRDGTDPDAIINTHHFIQENNPVVIDKWIQTVLEMYPEKILLYQSGKNNIIDMFIGEVMDISFGKANPLIVKRRLEGKLMKKPRLKEDK